MPTVEIPYSVQVKIENEAIVPINSYDFSTTSADVRQLWIDQIIKGLKPGLSGLKAIRTCDVVLNINGTVEIRADITPPAEKHRYVYPDRFRIPPATIEDLSLEEQVSRAEMFAFGSLVYQIYGGHKPFGNLPDDCVEERFANAEFPGDTVDLDQWPMILSSWSLEFARDLLNSNPSKLRDRFVNHIKSHPYLSALQASGLFVSVTSLSAPLLLGAVGFGAVGPIAGSAAAAWQSSMGLVQAGSLFTWCQSAAMGGAAVGGITATGAVGISAAAAATLAGCLTKGKLEHMTEEQIRDMAFRRGPPAEQNEAIKKNKSKL